MSEVNDRPSPHARLSSPGLTRGSSFGPERHAKMDGRVKPGHDVGRGRSILKRVVLGAAMFAVITTAAFAVWVYSLGPLPLDKASIVSTTVVDRNGKLLRAYAMSDGRWRLPVTSSASVDPGYLNILLGYEDKRFYDHHGVDPLALGRAAFQLVTRGQIVSGGSTITMQVARLLEPRRERSVHAKIRQAVRALQLERQMSKEQILDLYLTLAPFGGNLEGIRAASIAYFGKEPKRLSLAESALLVALPQSPEMRRLDRHPGNARVARDRVLERMVGEGRVSEVDATQAKSVGVPKLRKPRKVLMQKKLSAGRPMRADGKDDDEGARRRARAWHSHCRPALIVPRLCGGARTIAAPCAIIQAAATRRAHCRHNVLTYQPQATWITLRLGFQLSAQSRN